jgi:Sec-independent protein secretion pathway component TatC
MMGQMTGMLEDAMINVKLKIAALWAVVMFLFAYGDIFGYFRPGFIAEIMAGNVAGNAIDQVFLMFTAAYVTIPSLMVFLSLVLKPGISRPANIVLSIAYGASILLFCVGESYAYYIFLSVLECVLLLAIAWYAWNWPKQA